MRGVRYGIKNFGTEGVKERPTYEKTDAEKAANIIRKSAGCPLIQGGTIKMTREGFKRACIGRQKKVNRGWYVDGKAGMSPCRRCPIGDDIKEGRPFKAPKGIKFYSLKALKIWTGRH